MLRKADNVFSVVLDDNAATIAALPALGTVVTATNTPAGSIVVVDAGMRRLSPATYLAADRYRIVQSKGTGNQLMISPMITKANATLSTSNHRAAVQQKSIVGWSGVGTVGKLPVGVSTDYFIKIRKNDNDAANRSQPMSLFAGPVKSGAVPTEIDLAIALAGNGVANFKDEPANNYLEFGVICSNAGAATTSGTVTIAKGSRELTFGGVAGIVVVGAYLRINHTGVGAPAVATDSVYRITKIVGNVVTLDRAYTGITHAAAAAACTLAITQALAEAVANLCGVVMTGVEASFNVNSFRDYYANRFSVTFSDTTTTVTTTGARSGSGVWQQVAMDEYMSYGYEGQNEMLATPPTMRDQDVKIPGTGGATAATSRYGCLEISWTETIQGLVSLQGGKGSVMIYVNLSAAGTQLALASSFYLSNTILGVSATAFDV